MTFEAEIKLDSVKQEKKEKFEWYWAPVFCACWFLVFYAAVIPSYHAYPKVLSINDEHHHPDKFIGERAEVQLLGLTNIGVKLTGSHENEVQAVQFLLNEIDVIKSNARLDLYDIEVEVQFASGEFVVWGMATLYHNVQNIIVKIGPKGSASTSYLLVNSHFDSEVSSPAAGDAGVMIVVMLETLRVISRSTTPLKNPVVFLLNGAEEADFLGSHGFITQHKWAKNCKALINLDSAGSGGREILFQSGPNHPWLMRYYGKSVPHPFASTIAEELFQNDFIPSDTDFRIFRDHKGVPGLDLAHADNGYVYHTKYDRFSILPRGTYQNTGDNVLALTRALANAPELEEPEKHAEGHTVFYDYLGWFTMYYTETTGIILNSVVSACAMVGIGASFLLMIKETGYNVKSTIVRFLNISGVQWVAVLGAIGLTVLVGVIVDAMGLTLSWYKSYWMIFGLYFCPMFFVMGMVPALYLQWTKKSSEMSLHHSVHLFLHSQALILDTLTTVLTILAIRSAFLPMIGSFFYTCSVVLTLIANYVFKKKSLWIPIHLICTIPTFWFYTYLVYTFYNVFNAMQGRDGPDSTPELFVSAVTAILCAMLSGFIIPILLYFRKTKTFFSLFAVLTVVFVIIAATGAGFPFEKDVAAKRFYVLHTNRVFHGYNGETLRSESGLYVQPVDPRNDNVDDSVYKNASPLSYTQETCDKEMYCGLPLFNTRWLTWAKSSRWIPFENPSIPVTTDLKFDSKTLQSPTRVNFTYTLTGADRIVMYIEPLPGATVTDWSFNRIPLDEDYKPPYFIYYLYAVDKKPLEFWIELEIPILLYFRKSKTFFSVFAVITVIFVFVIIAATPVGFPYTKAIAPKRYTVVHTNRVFHGYDGETIRNESGFHVLSADPRKVNVDGSIYKNANPLSYTHENCEKELYCGLPVLNAGSRNRIKYSRWTPAGNPKLPETTELNLVAKTLLTSTKIRLEFTLRGADRTVIYISPVTGAEVTDWSFNRTPLEDKYPLPYFIYTAYAMDKRTLTFWIELERNNITWEGPTLRLTVAGHMQHHVSDYTQEYREYLDSFPEWSDPWAWIADVESWMF